MSDCMHGGRDVLSYDQSRPIRGKLVYSEGRPSEFTCSRFVNGAERIVVYVEIDGERYERHGCDYERGYRDGHDAAVAERGTCLTCGHSRQETHTGDAELVCWVRGTYGEKVDATHYCGKWVAR